MKNIFKKSLTFSFIALMVLSGCKRKGEDNGDKNFTYPTLAEAIGNTKEYGIRSTLIDEDGKTYFEISTDELYFISPSRQGVMILPEDPNYYHYISTSYIEEDNEILMKMDVHGRAGVVSQFDKVTERDFLSIINLYSSEFFKVEKSIWSYSGTGMNNEFKTFFQDSAYKYTNYFEVSIGKDGRLSEFRAYESDGNQIGLVRKYTFDKINIDKLDIVKRWSDNGRKINLRIVDLKTIYESAVFVKGCYEDEEVTIEGVVNAIDTDNNIYIANKNNTTGHIGIKVELANNQALPALHDRISVTGTIDVSGYTTYFKNATYTKVGTAKYIPIFDEEPHVDTQGGGVYAANYFSQNPYFNDSLYSTYGYTKTIPTSQDANGNLIGSIIFPDFETVDGEVLEAELVIPSNLSTTKKDEILDVINTYGVYNKESSSNQQLSIQNVITKFDVSHNFNLKFYVTEQTIFSKRLSLREQISNRFNLIDFPVVENKEYVSYGFGGKTEMYLEMTYNLDTTETEGLFISIEDLSASELDAYYSSLVDYGFDKYDVIKDVASGKHVIYKKNDIYLDITIAEASFEEGIYTINSWLYQGELVHGEFITDIVAKKVPFFATEDFVKLAGTYDADYSHFELTNYAGNDYSKDNPLNVFVLDSNEDLFSELRQAYIEKGYTQYRDENNRIYTYRTRGQLHYVYHKNGVFVDMAMYPTTDYTYAGHRDFTNRIEVLIYQADKPISTKYEENFDLFINAVVRDDGSEEFRFEVQLPEGTEIEILKKAEDYKTLEYGYYLQCEAFLYHDDLDAVYKSIEDGLLAAGYKKGNTKADRRSVIYSKVLNTGFTNSYITLMKETEKGYLRVINSVGGVDF